MQLACIVCVMAYRPAWSADRATRGPSCCGCSRATPTSSRARHRGLERGRERSAALYPSLGAAYPGLELVPFDPTRLAGLDLVFWRCRTASRSSSCGAGRRGAARRRSRRRLPPPAPVVRSSGTARPTPRPSCSTASRYGLPELYREDDRGAPPRRVARLLPDGGDARARAARGRGLVETDRDRRRRMSGVSGAGRALKRQPLLGGRRERERVRAARPTATPRRWSGARATSRARRAGALHPAPRADDAGILATCYARPAAEGLSTVAARDVARLLRRRAVRASWSTTRRPRRRPGANART